MSLTLLGRKQGMTQIFDEAGHRIPVTVVTVGPCIVTQIKTLANDGYTAVQIAFEDQKAPRVSKAQQGHVKAAKTTPKKTFQEFRCTPEEAAQFTIGMELKADAFQAGDFLDVTGTSKGRGFQGVMRRHGMPGFPASHGTHETFRGSGSIGMRTWPAKVIKGKRMEGHMGDETVTVQNLKVLEVNAKENAVVLKGCLPGHRRALVSMAYAAKRTKPAGRLKGKASEAAEGAKAEEAPAQ